MPLICAAQGFSDAEKALLLSGFYQGYIISQVPGAPIVQRYGGKGVMTATLAGTAAIFALAPALASRFRAAGLMVAFGFIGLCQGPMAPGLSQINREWIPTGQERVWALRASSLAHNMTSLLGAWAAPKLCAVSWQYGCWAMSAGCAAYAALWHLLAKSKPGGGGARKLAVENVQKAAAAAAAAAAAGEEEEADEEEEEFKGLQLPATPGLKPVVQREKKKTAAAAAAAAVAVTKAAAAPKSAAKAVEWGIFRLPAVQALTAYFVKQQHTFPMACDCAAILLISALCAAEWDIAGRCVSGGVRHNQLLDDAVGADLFHREAGVHDGAGGRLADE